MSRNLVALNHYQQLMWRLSQASAYNAVHAVVIDHDQEMQSKLQQAINTVIKQLALGNPEFSLDGQHVIFSPCIEPIPLTTCFCSIQDHVNRELNYVFARNEFPLRFFIITYQSEHYFSITYNHWVADAYAIYRLFEAIFNDLHQSAVSPLTLNAPRVEDCFKSIYKNRIFYMRYWGVIQSFFAFSRAFRTDVKNDECTDAACDIHCFEKEVLPQLTDFCKSHHITLNDLFMAILARLFGRITQEKRAKIKSKFLKPRRDRIMIGVIANIRGSSQLSLRETFGLFLGFFYLSFKSPEQYSLEVLLQRAHSQTRKMKRHYTAIKQFLLFKVQMTMWDSRKTKRSQYRLFSKNTPITVGISNMNLNQTEGALLNTAHQYIRFSPTAMVCPIVFNITTLNDCIALGINFRKACYTQLEAEKIKNEFIREINGLIST